jgi:hypothetical protein
VDTALRALPPQPVMLTVIAAGDEAELYLTFSEPAPGCLEISRRGVVMVAGGAS